MFILFAEIASSDEEPSDVAGAKNSSGTTAVCANAQLRASSVALCSLIGEYASDSEPETAAPATATASSLPTCNAPAALREPPLSSPKQKQQKQQQRHNQRTGRTRDADELAAGASPRAAADEGGRATPAARRPPRRERRSQPPPQLRWRRLTLLEKVSLILWSTDSIPNAG